MQIDFPRLAILRTRVVPRRLSYQTGPSTRLIVPTRLFSTYAVSEFRQWEEKKDIGLTAEYPCACFCIQALHLPLVRLPLVREFLGSSAVFACISRVTLFECTRHRVALSFGTRTQRHVMLILLVDEVLILESPLEAGEVGSLVRR